MGRRLLAPSGGGGGAALSRRPPLEPGQASGVPVPCSRTGGLLKTGRANPPHSPSAVPPAALTRTTRPPPFSSRARRRPGRRRRLPLFRDLLRRGGGPLPFLLPSRCFSGCLPHSPRGGGEGDLAAAAADLSRAEPPFPPRNLSRALGGDAPPPLPQTASQRPTAA